VFDPICVRGSQDGRRPAGQSLVEGVAGGPEPGAQLTTLLGIDPAMVGFTALCVYTFDRRSGRRWVIDVKVMKGPTPTQLREMIERLVDQYRPMEVVVEANGFQTYLAKDPLVTKMLASRGVVMRPHYTHSRNKLDPVYGVGSMAPLFGSLALVEHQKQHQKDNLISLPGSNSPGMKVLIDQLVSWDPDVATRKLTQDAVMAMWVAETRARELIVGEKGRQSFQPKSGFLSANDQAKRFTVRLSDAAEYARTTRSTFL
jgi:hypothetical protein